MARLDLKARKELLARAVWETVHEQGVSAVSVRTVAARAGVAVGSLRHVFPTRAELLRYSGELVVAQVTQRVMAVNHTGEALEVALELLSQLLPLDDVRRTEMEVNLALIVESPNLPELVAVRDEAAAAILRLCEVALELLGAAPGAETAARAQRLQFFVDGLALHLVQRPAHEDPSWASALLRAELARAASEAASAR